MDWIRRLVHFWLLLFSILIFLAYWVHMMNESTCMCIFGWAQAFVYYFSIKPSLRENEAMDLIIFLFTYTLFDHPLFFVVLLWLLLLWYVPLFHRIYPLMAHKLYSSSPWYCFHRSRLSAPLPLIDFRCNVGTFYEHFIFGLPFYSTPSTLGIIAAVEWTENGSVYFSFNLAILCGMRTLFC